MIPSASGNTLVGILCAVGGAVAFSINDVAIKFLSDGYALHQVVLLRSIVGLAVVLALMVPMAGGLEVLRTRKLGVHAIRGMCVVLANMAFFLALAAMPLADAVAIFFVSPLVITAFSVIFLREKVGPWRWAAVVVGLLGVVVVMRPGTAAFQLAALLPLVAAVLYAALHILTRLIGGTERAVTMAFYIQVTFVFVSAAIGLALGDGRFAGGGDPSLEFLFRAWVWPPMSDLPILILLGVASAMGGLLISQAYRLCEAGLAAPFEYVAMPLAMFWGLVVFGEWPDALGLTGIGLIMGGGLVMFWREVTHGRRLAGAKPPAPR